MGTNLENNILKHKKKMICFSSLKLFNLKENEVQIINTEGKRKTFNHTRHIYVQKFDN